jgi:hypothetical protein
LPALSLTLVGTFLFLAQAPGALQWNPCAQKLSSWHIASAGEDARIARQAERGFCDRFRGLKFGCPGVMNERWRNDICRLSNAVLPSVYSWTKGSAQMQMICQSSN